MVAGRAGGVGRFWGWRLSDRGSRLRTAGGGGGGRRSSGDLGPHPSRADFREGAGEGSRPGGAGIAGIETRTSRGSKVNPTEIKWWRSQGSKLEDLRDRKVFEVWGRTGLLLKIGPFRAGGRPLGWWNPPGRIDLMIGGSGGILPFVSLLLTFSKLLDLFWEGASRMVCVRSLRDRVVCGE